MTDAIVNLLALAGVALIVAGVALWSIPAAMVVGGLALLCAAYAIVRGHEHRQRTSR